MILISINSLVFSDYPYPKFGMVEYMMSSSSVYGSYIPLTPMTVRKEFPETWIWENLTNNGFVNN